MSCNNCNNPSCDSTCGCPQQVKGTCVFYQGANLDCLDVTKGDNYDSILTTLNSLICSLSPASGITTVVTGCDSVTVTSSTIGTTTTYNVCLSSDILAQINTSTSNFVTLASCVNQGVLNIVSSDSSILVGVSVPSSGCGRVLDLKVAPTPPVASIDGIIYSNTTTVNTTGGSGSDNYLKDSGSSIGSYYAANGLNVGDEIRFRANGQIQGDGSFADVIKFYFANIHISPISGIYFRDFSTPVDSPTSWEIEGTAIITDNTPTAAKLLLDIKLFRYISLNNIYNASSSARDLYVINREVTGINLNTLEIGLAYVRNTSSSVNTTNFAKQLVVEIRKAI